MFSCYDLREARTRFNLFPLALAFSFFRFMIEFNIMIPFAVDGWLNGGNGMMRTTWKRRDVSGKTKNAVFIHKNYCILTCLIFISIRMTAAATPADGTCSLHSLDRVNEWMSRTERCWMRDATWAKRTGEFNARSWAWIAIYHVEKRSSVAHFTSDDSHVFRRAISKLKYKF